MKPGIKTLEGILHVVAVGISAFMATGLWAQSWIVQVAGIIGACLASLGYGKMRTDLKIANLGSETSASSGIPNEDISIRTELK